MKPLAKGTKSNNDEQFIFFDNTPELNRKVINIVLDYLNNSVESVSKQMGYTFEEKSYSAWAANELITYLNDNNFIPPLILLERFRGKMYKYSCLNCVFCAAVETVDYVIETLLN